MKSIVNEVNGEPARLNSQSVILSAVAVIFLVWAAMGSFGGKEKDLGVRSGVKLKMNGIQPNHITLHQIEWAKHQAPKVIR